jgi:hypothetical protein
MPESVGDMGEAMGLRCWSKMEASETYIEALFACCTMTELLATLMGRGRWMASDWFRSWPAKRFLGEGDRSGLKFILYI